MCTLELTLFGLVSHKHTISYCFLISARNLRLSDDNFVGQPHTFHNAHFKLRLWCRQYPYISAVSSVMLAGHPGGIVTLPFTINLPSLYLMKARFPSSLAFSFQPYAPDYAGAFFPLGRGLQLGTTLSLSVPLPASTAAACLPPTSA